MLPYSRDAIFLAVLFCGDDIVAGFDGRVKVSDYIVDFGKQSIYIFQSYNGSRSGHFIGKGFLVEIYVGGYCFQFGIILFKRQSGECCFFI